MTTVDWTAIAIAALAAVKLLEVVQRYVFDRAARALAEGMASAATRGMKLQEQHLANHGVKLKPELEVANVVDIEARPPPEEP